MSSLPIQHSISAHTLPASGQLTQPQQAGIKGERATTYDSRENIHFSRKGLRVVIAVGLLHYSYTSPGPVFFHPFRTGLIVFLDEPLSPFHIVMQGVVSLTKFALISL